MRRFAAAFCLSLALIGPLAVRATEPIAEGPLNAEAWRADLRYLADNLPKKHGNLYHAVKPQVLGDAIARLSDRVPSLTSDQMFVEIMRIVALLQDGHNGLANRCGEGTATNYPLKLRMFSEGVYVIAAPPEHADVVGGRLVAIDGHPTGDIWSALLPLVPHDRDNLYFARARSHTFFNCSRVLHALGIISDVAHAHFTIERDRKTTTLTLAPEVSLGATYFAPPENWKRAEGPGGGLYLEHPERRLSFSYVEAQQLLYVRMSAVLDDKTQTMADFSKSVFAFADTHPVQKFVLDLRGNGGGNNYLTRSFLRGLLAHPALTEKGKLFVFTDGGTFSAAQNLTNRIENLTDATFIGEPTGENVNFYGDVSHLILPNSHIDIALANLYWQDKDPRDTRIATYPEISADMTAAAYLAGRDPAMDAVLRYAAQPPLGDQVVAAARGGGFAAALGAYDRYMRAPEHKYLNDPEDLVNEAGYGLLQQKEFPLAVAVLRVNAERFPNSWNAWDSLGEAYAGANDVPHAIAAYERSVALNAANSGGVAALQKLRAH